MADQPSVCPLWMSKKFTQLKKDGTIKGCQYYSGIHGAVTGLINHYRISSLIDHYGRNGKVFYFEPYHPNIDLDQVIKLAALFDCHVRIVESVWNPPQTTRFEFYREEK